MAWVLRRSGDNKFVSLPGQEHSYTRDIALAQKWPTREGAERSKCDNERAVEVDCTTSGRTWWTL